MIEELTVLGKFTKKKWGGGRGVGSRGWGVGSGGGWVGGGSGWM